MWVTTEDGRHVNTDWFDKDRQIAENKAEADNLNGKFHEWDDKRAQQEYKKYDYDVTSKEWKDSTMYTGGRYYAAIQRALYSGKMQQKTFNDGVKDMSPYIKAMDDSMRPLSENVMLSRTISYDQWENSVGLDIDTIQAIAEGGSKDFSTLQKAVGKSFTPKGFISTSYNENQNANVGAQVLLKLRTPAGTPAVVTSNKMESEVVLARNTSYTIVGYEVRQVAGTRKQIVFYADVRKKGK